MSARKAYVPPTVEGFSAQEMLAYLARMVGSGLLDDIDVEEAMRLAQKIHNLMEPKNGK